MEVRNNVRQRRRQRIEQLTGGDFGTPGTGQGYPARTPAELGWTEEARGSRAEAGRREFAMRGGREFPDEWPPAPDNDAEWLAEADRDGRSPDDAPHYGRSANEEWNGGARYRGFSYGGPVNEASLRGRPAPGAPAAPNARDADPAKESLGAANRVDSARTEAPPEEPDPEKWWKEKVRGDMRTRYGMARDEGPAASPAQPDGSRGAGGAVTPPFRAGPIGSLSNIRPYPGLSGNAGWEQGPPSGSSGSFIGRMVRGFAIRAVIACALLAALWGWIRLDLPGSGTAEAWTVKTLTEEMDVSAVEAWYENTFGDSPSFLPVFTRENPSQAVSAEWSREQTLPPLAGRVVQSFAQNGTGVRLAAPAGTAILAVHTGRVTQVTADDRGFATVLVQHANQVVSVYGNVDQAAVKAGDWIEAGGTLGELAPSAASANGGGEGTLYFAIMQNGKPLDPAEVVPLD